MITQLEKELIQSRALLVKAITGGDDAAILTFADRYLVASNNYTEALLSPDGIRSQANAQNPQELISSRNYGAVVSRPELSCDSANLAPRLSGVRTVSRHQCLIYEGSPSQQLATLAAMLVKQLKAGYRCLYLNNPPMVAAIRSHLSAAGLDVMGEVQRRALMLSSDQDHLVEGRFDGARMLTLLEQAVADALQNGFRGLWATGDMTWEFGPRKDFSKLLEYECGLEELLKKRPALCGVCQYRVDTLPAFALNEGLQTHRTLFVNDTLSRLNPCYTGNRSQ